MSETVALELDEATVAGLDRFRVADEDYEAVIRRTINLSDAFLRCEYITSKTKDRAHRIEVPFPDVDALSRGAIDDYQQDPPAGGLSRSFF